MLTDPRRALRLASLAVGVLWLPFIVRFGPLPHDLTYDDAWYYFEIGRNIADGAGSTFDGMHTTNGYHPLWMLITSGVYLVGFDDLAAVRAVLVLQLGLWIGALWLLGGVLADAVGRWPALAGRADEATAGKRGTLLMAAVWFVIGANPYVFKLFVNGLETGIAALVGVGLLTVAARHEGDPLRRPAATAALAGLAFLARTDAVFIVAALLCWSALLRRGIDRVVLAVGAAFGVVVLAYLASNLALISHPLQVSGVTKRVDPDLARGITTALCVAAAAGVMVAGLRARSSTQPTKLPRTRAWFGTSAWWLAGSLALLGYEWGFTTEIYLWHYAPQVLWGIATLPHAIADIFEGATVERSADHPAATTRSRAVAMILLLPFAAGGLWQLGSFVDPELRSMQLGDRATGEWIAANLPSDAVVGSFDAGVIGYFADRPVVNLDGLVNSFDWYDARHDGVAATSTFLADAGITNVANHGDPVDGDEPTLRDAIDSLLGDDAGQYMQLVHRVDYVYRGEAGGRSGRRPYATFVWELLRP